MGWQGIRTGFLPQGTQIYICSEREVDFGFSRKSWSQVAYRDGNNWSYGWILKDNWTVWKSMNGSIENNLAEGHFLIAAALAGEPPMAKNEPTQWTIPNRPPKAPPSKVEETVSVNDTIGLIAWGDLITLYTPLFVAMLIGMIAKAIVDYLDAWDRTALFVHLRNGITAVLVSPIVFLGFLTAGQFSTSKQTFIVLWLLAFQNGFFWQTVLKKEVRPRPKAPSDPAVGGEC